MNTIRIGQSEKPLKSVTESWINHQVRQREEHGESVCVQVSLQSDSIQLLLSTPQCGGVGGGRTPNTKENDIIAKWNDHHLNRNNWTAGNLISFLKQMKLLR